MTNQANRNHPDSQTTNNYLVYIVMVTGFEFLERHPLDEGMGTLPDSLWRQAIQHSHFHTNDENQIKEWVSEGLENGCIDLGCGYRIEEPWITNHS